VPRYYTYYPTQLGAGGGVGDFLMTVKKSDIFFIHFSMSCPHGHLAPVGRKKIATSAERLSFFHMPNNANSVEYNKTGCHILVHILQPAITVSDKSFSGRRGLLQKMCIPALLFPVVGTSILQIAKSLIDT